MDTIRHAHTEVIILCKIFYKIKPFVFSKEDIC